MSLMILVTRTYSFNPVGVVSSWSPSQSTTPPLGNAIIIFMLHIAMQILAIQYDYIAMDIAFTFGFCSLAFLESGSLAIFHL